MYVDLLKVSNRVIYIPYEESKIYKYIYIYIYKHSKSTLNYLYMKWVIWIFKSNKYVKLNDLIFLNATRRGCLLVSKHLSISPPSLCFPFLHVYQMHVQKFPVVYVYQMDQYSENRAKLSFPYLSCKQWSLRVHLSTKLKMHSFLREWQ